MPALSPQAQQYFAGVRDVYSPKIEEIVQRLKATGEAFQACQQELKAEWGEYMRSACNAQPGDIIEMSDGSQVLLAALIPEEHALPGGVQLRTFYPLVHARTEDGWSANLARLRYVTLPFKVVGSEEVKDDGRTLTERMAQALPDLVEAPKPVPLADDTVEEKPDVATEPAKPEAEVPAKRKRGRPRKTPVVIPTEEAPVKRKRGRPRKNPETTLVKKSAAKKSAPKKKATKKTAAKKKVKKKVANAKKVRTPKKSDKSD